MARKQRIEEIRIKKEVEEKLLEMKTRKTKDIFYEIQLEKKLKS